MSTAKYIIISFVALIVFAVVISITRSDLLIGFWSISAIIWFCFLPIEIYIAIKENNVDYINQRGKKRTASLFSLLSSEKAREKRAINLLVKNNDIEIPKIKKLFSEVVNNKLAKEASKLDTNKNIINDMLNNKEIIMEKIEKCKEEQTIENELKISKLNEEIVSLKKQIVKEKDDFTELQSRHKYLDLWVKNR